MDVVDNKMISMKLFVILSLTLAAALAQTQRATLHFAPDTYHEKTSMSGISIVGFCLGFIAFGILFPFAVVMIVLDQIRINRKQTEILDQGR